LGNTYPVIENPNSSDSLKGKPCQSGFDSHFTIVEPGSYTPCPLKAKSAEKKFTEFVIFQENQCVASYLLFVKP